MAEMYVLIDSDRLYKQTRSEIYGMNESKNNRNVAEKYVLIDSDRFFKANPLGNLWCEREQNELKHDRTVDSV